MFGLGRAPAAPLPPPGPFPAPLPLVLWGCFFHPFSAYLSYRMTTKIPFVGAGTGALIMRIVFAILSIFPILNHVYHLVAMLGISLEVQDNLFLGGLVFGVVPSLYCLCRCFFLALPRKQALLLTVLNISAPTVWPVICMAASGLPSEQPSSVLGTPEFLEAHGMRFVAQHIAVEIGITIGYLITYKQFAPFIGDKAHTA